MARLTQVWCDLALLLVGIRCLVMLTLGGSAAGDAAIMPGSVP